MGGLLEGGSDLRHRTLGSEGEDRRENRGSTYDGCDVGGEDGPLEGGFEEGGCCDEFPEASELAELPLESLWVEASEAASEGSCLPVGADGADVVAPDDASDYKLW